MSKSLNISFAAAAAATAVVTPGADAQTVKDARVAGIALATLAKDAPAQIKLYDASGKFHFQLKPFGEAKGGVNVAGGDINGDGRADLIVGQAEGPHVNVFDGVGYKDRQQLSPFGAEFTGGVSVAAGDLNGDGKVDIVTGAGPGGGPHVRVFDGNGATLRDFDAFESKFQGGVRVASGDVNGDGRADLIVSTALGDGSVRTFDGATGELIGELLPYGGDYKDGVAIAAGRFLGQDVLFASKIVGDGSVRVLSLARGGESIDFQPFGADYKGGVAIGFTFKGGIDTLVVGQTDGGTVGFLDVTRRAEIDVALSTSNVGNSGLFFKPFGDDYSGGISVAGLGPTAAIPEPATWATMLIGFAGIGLGARRRLRKDEAAVTAA